MTPWLQKSALAIYTRTMIRRLYLIVSISCKLCYSLRGGLSFRPSYLVFLKSFLFRPAASKLTDFIGQVLCKLYLKHDLYLLDQCVDLYVYIAGSNLLNPFLTIGSTSLSNSVTNTYIGRDYNINNNLISILQIQVSYYTLWAVLIAALIPGAFLVFVWCFETKFVLYGCITNYFKKIVE